MIASSYIHILSGIHTKCPGSGTKQFVSDTFSGTSVPWKFNFRFVFKPLFSYSLLKLNCNLYINTIIIVLFYEDSKTHVKNEIIMKNSVLVSSCKELRLYLENNGLPKHWYIYILDFSLRRSCIHCFILDCKTPLVFLTIFDITYYL